MRRHWTVGSGEQGRQRPGQPVAARVGRKQTRVAHPARPHQATLGQPDVTWRLSYLRTRRVKLHTYRPQSERMFNLTRGVFGAGFRRARQFAQQPVTMPELVRRYRDFAGLVASAPVHGKGRGLIVAIDEMDRIASAESAEMFLNQIKATFGIPECTYLVSVSEDALAQFERRVSTMRTTVDTSFDEVVWLPEFSLAESIALLRCRLTGFPDLFLALCYCLSGGVPRDLLRAARSLVDARRDLGISELDDIAQVVVRAEIQAFGRGVLRSLALRGSPPYNADGAGKPDIAVDAGSAAAHEALAKMLFDEPLAAPGSLAGAVETFSRLEGDAALECAAVLSYYATVEALFLHGRETVQAALVEPRDSTASRLIADLGAVRSILPGSPRFAVERLATIRREAGLEEARHANASEANDGPSAVEPAADQSRSFPP